MVEKTKSTSRPEFYELIALFAIAAAGIGYLIQSFLLMLTCSSVGIITALYALRLGKELAEQESEAKNQRRAPRKS